MKTGGVQFHLSFTIPLHISYTLTHDKNPTLAQKSGAVWSRCVLHPHLCTFLRTTKFRGDVKGGVSDTGCQCHPALQCIPFQKASFLSCGNRTSSPSFSKSFGNVPDLFSPAEIIQNLLLHSTSQKNRCSWVHLGTAAVWTPGPHQLSPPFTHPPLCHVATCASCAPEIPWEKNAMSGIRRSL